MNILNTLAFVIFPYLALSTFVVGNLYRYVADPYDWNSKSSELLDKDSLKYGSTVFHWGIILALVGHGGGLLIPQKVYDALGIDSRTHTKIAIVVGLIVGLAAFIGLILLVWRRLTRKRVLATTTTNDFITLGLLLFVAGSGTANVIRGIYQHFNVLDTIAPWLRGIVTLTPDPMLIAEVPLSYKIHVLGAFALIGFSPFSRLVHIWSAPITYLFRRWIIFRRREAGCPH